MIQFRRDKIALLADFPLDGSLGSIWHSGLNPTNQKYDQNDLYSVQIFIFLKMLTDIWNWVHIEVFWRTFSEIQLVSQGMILILWKIWWSLNLLIFTEKFSEQRNFVGRIKRRSFFNLLFWGIYHMKHYRLFRWCLNWIREKDRSKSDP
jgi:hypothetical protein